MPQPRRHAVSALALAAALALLSACAPSARPSADGASVETRIAGIHYHPRQAGIRRAYQPEGQPGELRIDELGPTVRDGQTLYVTRSYGLGLDLRRYREHTPSGVFRVRDEYASHTVTYDPPLQEYPATIEPGRTWGGATRAHYDFPGDEHDYAAIIDYAFTAVQRRNVTINGRQLDVVVIDFEATQRNAGQTLAQQHWYAPHLGVVRTPDDLYLVNTNLPTPRR